MPENFGNWNSVYRTHYRWSQDGLWDEWFNTVSSKHVPGVPFAIIDATHIKVHQDACRYAGDPEVQGLGKSKGGRNSKLSCAVNREGKPISFVLMPGNRNDIISARDTLEGHAQAIVLGDKAYDSNEFRQFIKDSGGFPMISPKKNRVVPIFYDRELGKERRKVENYFCRLKRYRRVNTRYDKRSDTFMGFVFLAAIRDWLD